MEKQNTDKPRTAERKRPGLFDKGESPAPGPDFICIGAQKGGTRWLFDQTEQHRDFWMPPVKELHYFNQEMPVEKARKLLRPLRQDLESANAQQEANSRRHFDKRDRAWLEAYVWLKDQPYDLDLYAKLFVPKGDLLSGDITPPYALIPREQAQAIRARFPAAKIVYLARDPIDRTWSQYSMAARNEKWDNADNPKKLERFLRNRRAPDLSSVALAVDNWQTSPDDPNLRVFFFDDLRDKPDDLRRRILTFLGADPEQPSAVIPPDFNRKGKLAKVEMQPAMRARLIELFADEIRLSAARFGGPAAAWPAKYGL